MNREFEEFKNHVSKSTLKDIYINTLENRQKKGNFKNTDLEFTDFKETSFSELETWFFKYVFKDWVLEEEFKNTMKKYFFQYVLPDLTVSEVFEWFYGSTSLKNEAPGRSNSPFKL